MHVIRIDVKSYHPRVKSPSYLHIETKDQQQSHVER